MLFNNDSKMLNLSNHNFVKFDDLYAKTYTEVFLTPLQKIKMPSTGGWQPAYYSLGGFSNTNDYIDEFNHLRNYDVSFESPLRVIGGYFPDQQSVNFEMNTEFYDEEFVYGGILFEHFGHFLVESLSRLWYVVKHEYKGKILFYTENSAYNKGFVQTIFKLLGINNQIVIIEKAIRVKKVIIPEQAMIYQYSIHQDYLLTYNKIFNAVLENNRNELIPQNIYISRTKLGRNGQVFGEEKVEKFFESQDFTVIYPEQLPLEKQILLIGSAEKVAGINGSALHLLLFNRKKPQVIDIIRQNYLQANYFMFDQILENDPNYLFVGKTTINTSGTNGPFELDLSTLSEGLKLLDYDADLAENYTEATESQQKLLLNWLEQRIESAHVSMSNDEKRQTFLLLSVLDNNNITYLMEAAKLLLNNHQLLEAATVLVKVIKLDTKLEHKDSYQTMISQLIDGGMKDAGKNLVAMLHNYNGDINS